MAAIGLPLQEITIRWFPNTLLGYILIPWSIAALGLTLWLRRKKEN